MCFAKSLSASRELGSVGFPDHAGTQQTQNEDAQADAEQRVLYDLQHVHPGEELLLKHLCSRFVH